VKDTRFERDRDIKIKVQAYGKTLNISLPDDSDIGEVVHELRVILNWIDYGVETIEEYVPDPEREWKYIDHDEEEPDEWDGESVPPLKKRKKEKQ
jgi:hypothetical protein